MKSDPEITMQSTTTGTILYLGLNQKNQYLSKPEVRTALKYLVDYDAIERNILAGTFVVHQAFLPQGFFGGIDDRPYEFDLAKARDLLTAAKLDKGFAVTMDVQGEAPWTDIAQAIQASFAQAGIKLEIIAADRRQITTKYRARNHEIVLTSWGPDYPDPHTNAQAFAMNSDNSDNSPTKMLAWRNGWDIPEMTKDAEAAVVERDSIKRAAMYEALQREHQRVSPFVPMFQQIEVVAHRKSAEGFTLAHGALNTLYATIVKH
jgi:peptide/nickel transport system substrate-binding protein